MSEQKITPSDLRKLAQQLIREGNMPTPEQFAKVMGESRDEYLPKLDRLREQDKQQ
jgi:hypothetical protein